MPDAPISACAPVLLDMDETTEVAVIDRLIQAMANHPHVVDAGELRRAVLERQQLQPPLLGNGVALPHARTQAVSELVMAIGRCRQPIPFGAGRMPIRLVFLYGVPTQRISAYLDSVARLTRALRNPATLETLLTTTDEAQCRMLVL